MTAGPRLAAIGGGSGLAVLLRGLKRALAPEHGAVERLTAVVTVTDDGGSSGRLRRELGVLPPGDIRNCLVALADDEDLLARLFQYRFPTGAGLTGHSFGNLFLTALTGITGDFYQAILTAESVLSVRGRILPATLEHVRLTGRGRSGRRYLGETALGTAGEAIDELALEPAAPPAFAPAAAALAAADLVILGPGSLYTSILPNLLIPGIRRALESSRARVVLPLNLMTQPGETDGMDALAHLEAIERHAGAALGGAAAGTGAAGGRLVDAVLVNAAPPAPALLARYAESGSEPVAVDRAALEAAGVEVVAADLLAEGELIRHDPERLAAALLAMAPRPGAGAGSPRHDSPPSRLAGAPVAR